MARAFHSMTHVEVSNVSELTAGRPCCLDIVRARLEPHVSIPQGLLAS